MAIYQSQYTGKQIDDAIANQKKMSEIVIRNSKQIENLKQGSVDQFKTDLSVAYVKNVPENALPYAEIKKIGGMTYKDGNTLKSAKVTAVESMGANLLNQAAFDSHNNCTIESDENSLLVTVVAGDPLVFYNGLIEFFNSLPKGQYYFYSEASGGAYTDLWVNQAPAVSRKGYFNMPENLTLIHFELEGYTVGQTYTVKLAIYKVQRDEYTPYVKHTLPIPEAVQAIDGYGDGVNESVYNYIDWEKKQFVKRARPKIIDTVLDVVYTYANVKYYGIYKPLDFIGYKSTSDSFVFPKFKNMVYSEWDDGAHIGEVTGNADYDLIWFGFPIGTTIEQARTELIGLPFVYELATPEITDISDLISSDNLIEVEGGGTLSFKNKYKYAVPSEVEYQVEV